MQRRTRHVAIGVGLLGIATAAVYFGAAHELDAATLAAEGFQCALDASEPPADALWPALERVNRIGRVPWLQQRAYDVHDRHIGRCRAGVEQVCRAALDDAVDHAVQWLRAERERRLAAPDADEDAVAAWYDAQYDKMPRATTTSLPPPEFHPRISADMTARCEGWKPAADAFARWVGKPLACPACDLASSR
jgi:hypothetical protein